MFASTLPAAARFAPDVKAARPYFPGRGQKNGGAAPPRLAETGRKIAVGPLWPF